MLIHYGEVQDVCSKSILQATTFLGLPRLSSVTTRKASTTIHSLSAEEVVPAQIALINLEQLALFMQLSLFHDCRCYGHVIFTPS